MNILAIQGSPRLKGNTAAIVDSVRSLLPPEHDLQRIDIASMSIGGCLGCDACFRRRGVPGCVQRDGANELFELLIKADAILYATPLYLWSFSAQIKAFMDRHYSLVKWEDGRVVERLLEGQQAALLVTCGGAAAENADTICVEFDREMDYLGCRLVGRYIVDRCSTPDKLGDRREKVAREIVESLCNEGRV